MKSLTKYSYLVLPFALLLAGLYLVPLNIYGPDFSKVPGDFGDARFNNYILEHDYSYFTGKVDTYWDAPFMYPYKNVIAFSDNLLGTAPIYAIFRIIGSDRETAFQYWLIALFILNFVFCYWTLRKWSINNVLSSTGAYIFSFSILLVGNIYNVQTVPRFIVPLVFYWCWKYFTQKEIKYFLYLSLGIVFQFYCGIYLGFLLLYALLFLFVAYILVYWDFSLFSQFKKMKTTGYHILILVIIFCIFYPFIQPYILISKDAGIPSFEEVLPSIPTFRSYFFTSKAPILWGALSDHAVPVLKNWWCHFLFIGALPWIGIVGIPFVFLIRQSESKEKKFIAFLFLSLFLCFIFCINIDGFTLYKYIYHIPGFSAMRSMNRIINIEILFFILIFVFVFNELSKYSRVMKWVVLCFPILVILDNAIKPAEIVSYDKKESQNQIALVRKEIESKYNNKYKAIAYMPFNDENRLNLHINTMLACQELNMHCVNAYTGHTPGPFNNFYSQLDAESLTNWCAFNNIKPESIQQIPASFQAFEENGIYQEQIVNLLGFQRKFVSANEANKDTLIANKEEAKEGERFNLIYLGSNWVVLKSFNNKYVTIDQSKNNLLIANADSIEQAAKLVLIKQDSGYFAFKTNTGLYLCADQTLEGKLIANRTFIGVWEKFRIIKQEIR